MTLGHMGLGPQLNANDLLFIDHLGLWFYDYTFAKAKSF